MTIQKKGLTLSMILVSFGIVFASGADMGSMDHSSKEMGASMVPFHIAEIVVALIVFILVSKVITATGQANVFIYIPIAMLFFVIGSIVAYSPHFGMMSGQGAAIGSTALSTIAILLMGVSFYKWKKMLG